MKRGVLQRNLFVLLLFYSGASQAQELQLVAIPHTDSTFVRRHFLRNDIRIFYGYQANSLTYGSLRDGNPKVSGDLYKNFNDFIGLGITYKWIDGNLTFSIPRTTYLNQERSNLDQFTLGLNATGRVLAFRGYLENTKGVIAETSDPNVESTPTLHQLKIVAQMTYIFNTGRYSYRAALYQSQQQLKTADTWMVRAELFYRALGAKQKIVEPPYDVPERFGNQTGLRYVQAPGLLLMPGYGVNVSLKQGKYFLSPMVFAGGGVAFNRYKSDSGTQFKPNIEWSGMLSLNAGYNGNRMYCKLQSSVSIGYAKIDPAYLLTKDLQIVLLFGYRFTDLESWLPRSFK